MMLLPVTEMLIPEAARGLIPVPAQTALEPGIIPLRTEPEPAEGITPLVPGTGSGSGDGTTVIP